MPRVNPDPKPAPNKSDEEFVLPLAGFTGTPEEQDRQWFEQCYRGDSQRQLTVRAVVMGGLLGMFTAVSNLYTTLKIGWSFGVSITACVISFVVWNSICKILGGRVSRMSILENNCMQSTHAVVFEDAHGTEPSTRERAHRVPDDIGQDARSDGHPEGPTELHSGIEVR